MFGVAAAGVWLAGCSAGVAATGGGSAGSGGDDEVTPAGGAPGSASADAGGSFLQGETGETSQPASEDSAGPGGAAVGGGAPQASAGADLSVAPGSRVALDGSASFDPDGDVLWLRWEQMRGLPVVTLSDAGTTRPSFNVPFVGQNTTLVFSLTVGDGDSESQDLVLVEIDVGLIPEVIEGLSADAGPDLVVAGGESVLLDGTASSAGRWATFAWTQLSGPPGEILDADRIVAAFVAPLVADEPQVVTCRLVVSEGSENAADLVTIRVYPDFMLPDDLDSDGLGTDGLGTDGLDTDGPPGDEEDADGDGLPDWWELLYFGDIDSQDGNDNPDGDPIDNATEYWLRSDPTAADADQAVVNLMSVGGSAFFATGGGFNHVADGALVGWPIYRTADRAGPSYWAVDNGNLAEQPILSVMTPGVPWVGMSYLRAYKVTGNKLYLEYALAAAKTLLSLQRDLEQMPSGALRPALERGGWIDYAVVIPDNAETRANVPQEVGHWTTIQQAPGSTALIFRSRLDSYMAFDDSISVQPALFLLELYDEIRSADFSGEPVDPLAGFNRGQLLDGARRLFELVERYRTDFALRTEDFAGVTIEFDGDNRAKDGPHPFNAYLANLPADHPLKLGQAYRPYADGGLPHGAEEIERLIAFDGDRYGALAAGRLLHKYVNDHVESRLLLFLMRYYQITGAAAALQNLQVQMNWLVDRFEADGSRGWCRQYHVLDGQCAAARPYEPPAIAMAESIYMIRYLAWVEKTLEEQYGLSNDAVRRTLEDALYYAERVVVRDDPGKLFLYYALDDYDASTVPSAQPAITVNDPMFACDCYYPNDPFGSCGPEYVGFHFYRIDESNGEFIPPGGYRELADLVYSSMTNKMIDDACAADAQRPDFRGCLDLDRDYANARDYWDVQYQAWTFGIDNDAAGFLVSDRPNADGLWTSTQQIGGQPRTVVDTALLGRYLFGMCRYLTANGVVATDSDSDGLSNNWEQAVGTDPRYPDTDKDGVTDGDEVQRDGTDPTNPASHG